MGYLAEGTMTIKDTTGGAKCTVEIKTSREAKSFKELGEKIAAALTENSEKLFGEEGRAQKARAEGLEKDLRSMEEKAVKLSDDLQSLEVSRVLLKSRAESAEKSRDSLSATVHELSEKLKALEGTDATKLAEELAATKKNLEEMLALANDSHESFKAEMAKAKAEIEELKGKAKKVK